MGCNINDPLSTIPNLKGDGAYGNLRAQVDDDSGDGDLEEMVTTISTADIQGWGASQPDAGMARATGISVPLPPTQAAQDDEEQQLAAADIAFLDDYIDLDAFGNLRAPVAQAPNDDFT